MSDQVLYRFNHSTFVEPLVNRWSAFPNVISPVPASLHLVGYQIKVMQSYLENPAHHVAASRNPELIGGPYLDVPVEMAQQIRTLLEETVIKLRPCLELASVLMGFQQWLVGEVSGQSLEPYYQQVPRQLRGKVELVYDYFNRPTVRFMEAVFYKSQYYNPDLQSFDLTELVRDEDRPFFFTTPRIRSKASLEWRQPFCSSLVDELFRLDLKPQPLRQIAEIMGMSEQVISSCGHFVAANESSARLEIDEARAHVRYFGHACLLLQWKNISILTDPFAGVSPSSGGMERFSYQDLPAKIDYVLITHAHQDHFALETLLRLRHRIGCLVVPKSFGMNYGDISLKLLAGKLGFTNVVEMDSFDYLELPDGEIVAVPFLGEHADLAIGKTAYVVRMGGEKALIGADSNCLDRQIYDNLRAIFGQIQTLFIGTESVGAPLTWGCMAYFPKKPLVEHEQSRRYRGCDGDASLQMMEAIGAHRVFNYAIGLEPWFRHLLGLNLSADAPQIRESDKLIQTALQRGATVARRLCCKDDFYL